MGDPVAPVRCRPQARERKVDEAGDRIAFVTGNAETLPLRYDSHADDVCRQ